ncbi:thermonuclease family protein [Chloroflexota bacterium]
MKKALFLSLVILIVSFTIACVSPIDHTVAQIQEDLPQAPVVDTTKAKVIRVIDGDTIEVQISGNVYSVRYIGIDTPERNQLGYQEARNANSELVMGKNVLLEKDVSEVDRYRRLLRYVRVEGHMVNAILVVKGFDERAIYPPDTLYTTDFSILERSAKKQRIRLVEVSVVRKIAHPISVLFLVSNNFSYPTATPRKYGQTTIPRIIFHHTRLA